MKLYLSIDLESWAYPNNPRFINLDSPARKRMDNGFVPESANKILDLLAKYNQKITFFVLGELFEWYPEIFRKIQKAGHEIAYHTHRHIIITGADVIRKEIERSKDFLSEFKPIGFRAPQIYLLPEAIRPLLDNGFRYSSSVYGSYSDVFKSEGLIEFPISTISKTARVFDYPRKMSPGIILRETPFGWAGFLEGMPISAIEKCIQAYLKKEKRIFMFLHNWQIVPPPKDANFGDKTYKYVRFFYKLRNIRQKNETITKKIDYLLNKYTISRMDELV